MRISSSSVIVLFSIPVVALFLACASGTAETTVAEAKNQEPMTTEDARNVYTLHCVSCHGVDGKLGNSGAADLSKSIMTEAGIKRTITKGNNKGMMPYGEILSQREIAGLAKFVKTLRKKK